MPSTLNILLGEECKGLTILLTQVVFNSQLINPIGLII